MYKKDTPITIKINSEDKKIIEELAKQKDINISDFIREKIENEIKIYYAKKELEKLSNIKIEGIEGYINYLNEAIIKLNAINKSILSFKELRDAIITQIGTLNNLFINNTAFMDRLKENDYKDRTLYILDKVKNILESKQR